ncbi:MAG TPA: DUF58 domain-containing protein [Candidatus Pullilachnospira intestinigallinarum]|nr:DUF58 domain-containing protein [Candidatus Pullilachnospira intestinigallinarum]
MTIVVILLGAFLINYLLDACFRSFWSKNLTVQVRFQDQPAMEGQEARLTETIANGKRLFLPLLQVGFQVHRDLWFSDGENTSVSDQCYKRDVFSVGGYQKITRTIPFRCTHRGYYELEKVELVTRSPLMTRKYYETLESRDFFYVYPRLVDSEQLDISFQKVMGSVLASRNLYEDPFEFRGIREYGPADPMNKINWKAAARTGELMVNLYGSTTAQEVMILLDVEDETIWKYDEIHEEEIRIAASLASRCIQEGIPVGFRTNGKDIRNGRTFVLKAGCGEQQVRLVSEGLARLDLNQKADPMEFVLDREREMGTGTSTTYVMISKNQRPSCVEAFLRLAREGSGCIWIATLYAEMEWKLPREEQIRWIRWEVEK